jgi:hypothetical protein
MVSLITLPGDDRGELTGIAMNAAHFGLHTFCSEGVARRMTNCLDFWRCTAAFHETHSRGSSID